MRSGEWAARAVAAGAQSEPAATGSGNGTKGKQAMIRIELDTGFATIALEDNREHDGTALTIKRHEDNTMLWATLTPMELEGLIQAAKLMRRNRQ